MSHDTLKQHFGKARGPKPFRHANLSTELSSLAWKDLPSTASHGRDGSLPTARHRCRVKPEKSADPGRWCSVVHTCVWCRPPTQVYPRKHEVQLCLWGACDLLPGHLLAPSLPHTESTTKSTRQVLDVSVVQPHTLGRGLLQGARTVVNAEKPSGAWENTCVPRSSHGVAAAPLETSHQNTVGTFVCGASGCAGCCCTGEPSTPVYQRPCSSFIPSSPRTPNLPRQSLSHTHGCFLSAHEERGHGCVGQVAVRRVVEAHAHPHRFPTTTHTRLDTISRAGVWPHHPIERETMPACIPDSSTAPTGSHRIRCATATATTQGVIAHAVCVAAHRSARRGSSRDACSTNAWTSPNSEAESVQGGFADPPPLVKGPSAVTPPLLEQAAREYQRPCCILLLNAKPALLACPPPGCLLVHTVMGSEGTTRARRRAGARPPMTQRCCRTLWSELVRQHGCAGGVIVRASMSRCCLAPALIGCPPTRS